MKIIPPTSIAVVCEQLRLTESIVVLAYGVFDLLHPGHIHCLREARKLGTHLIVALNTDDSGRKRKGILRPILPLEERAEVLAALEIVSYVTWFNEDTPQRIVSKVKPNVLINGTAEAAALVESAGGRAVSIPVLSGYSTSNIVENIIKLP